MTRNLRGRPPASSKEMLQDAAFDLFLENTYAKTTIENITQRAGVSRATFFNYFASKSDVFWVDLDQTLELLADNLARRIPAEPRSPLDGLRAVEDALLTVAAQLGTDRVPFALTQYEFVGSAHELQASALARLSNQAAIVTNFLVDHALPASRARAAAYACMAAVIAGAQEWAAQGTTRAPLETCLKEAIGPVIAGFGEAERSVLG